MELQEYLSYLNSGKTVIAGSKEHEYMHKVSQDAIRLCTELNSKYNTPEEIRKLMSEIIGQPMEESFAMFPPFYTDCGKNIHIGKGVFINSGCRFQDQGGIYIGDNALIGHNVVLATINHRMNPNERKDMDLKPIVIEENVWIGANATILQGVTIGKNAVIAAGAVVVKDVPANTVVGGVPAKILEMIET